MTKLFAALFTALFAFAGAAVAQEKKAEEKKADAKPAAAAPAAAGPISPANPRLVKLALNLQPSRP